MMRCEDALVIASLPLVAGLPVLRSGTRGWRPKRGALLDKMWPLRRVARLRRTPCNQQSQAAHPTTGSIAPPLLRGRRCSGNRATRRPVRRGPWPHETWHESPHASKGRGQQPRAGSSADQAPSESSTQLMGSGGVHSHYLRSCVRAYACRRAWLKSGSR